MPNILHIAPRACVKVLVPELSRACIYLMLYYVKLHEIKFYVASCCLPDALPGLPPRPDAFRASQNPPPCRAKFPATPGRACRAGKPDPGWRRPPTTPGPNLPGRFGCAIRKVKKSRFTRGARYGKCAVHMGT